VSVGMLRRSGVCCVSRGVALLDGMDLDAMDVTYSLVHWADSLYNKPASKGLRTRPARGSWGTVWTRGR
jgi:hypothetical protein